MASARKVKANRANARSSTGPNTAQGKTRAAQNARRHGLSISITFDPALSEEAKVLAREIAGEGADHEIYQLARRIADAQIELRRVRDARHQILSNNLNDPYYKLSSKHACETKTIGKLFLPNAPEMTMAELTRFVMSTPQGSHKLAIILSEEAKQLRALDRFSGARCRGASLPFVI